MRIQSQRGSVNRTAGIGAIAFLSAGIGSERVCNSRVIDWLADYNVSERPRDAGGVRHPSTSLALEMLPMFWNLFARRPAPRSSVRPMLEALEDRTTPTAISTVAAQSGLSMMVSNPTLASANAVLNNQMAGELAFLPVIGTAATNQLFSSTLGSSFQLANSSGLPNATANSLLLFTDESVLSTDLALLILNPSLAGNGQFAASVDSLVASIRGNPLFFNPFGFTEAFTAGALVLNNELSPFFANASGQSGFASGATTNFNQGTTPFGFGQSQTGFNTPASAQTSAVFGLGAMSSGFAQFSSGLTAAPFGITDAAYGFGSIPTI